MFGHRFFGGGYFGPRYFGPSVPAAPASQGVRGLVVKDLGAKGLRYVVHDPSGLWRVFIWKGPR